VHCNTKDVVTFGYLKSYLSSRIIELRVAAPLLQSTLGPLSQGFQDFWLTSFMCFDFCTCEGSFFWRRQKGREGVSTCGQTTNVHVGFHSTFKPLQIVMMKFEMVNSLVFAYICCVLLRSLDRFGSLFAPAATPAQCTLVQCHLDPTYLGFLVLL
jgi:hypothetical protein